MSQKLSNQELFHFCEQLSLLLQAGVSCTEGLSLLLEDSAAPHNRELLTSLLHSMEETGQFSESLQKTGVFPDSMISYTKIGEETGCLDEVMASLANHYEQEMEISSQIRSAVTYPLIMLGMLGAVILILFVRVLPVFQQVFRQMGMEMNGISKKLLDTGTLLNHYSIVFFIFLALIIIGILFLARHPKGRVVFQKIIYHIPGLRDIPLAMDYVRLTHGIALGIRSGLVPETSLEMAKMLVSHPLLLQRSQKACKLLADGATFSQAMLDSELFYGMEARLISVGFHTGAADEVMKKLSKRYQENALSLLGQTVSFIEPTIVILLSIFVGLTLLSVMMPLMGILSEIVL